MRLNPKAFSHSKQLEAADPPTVVFQPGDRVPASVPPFQLHGLGQLQLAPATLQPVPSHLGTDYI